MGMDSYGGRQSVKSETAEVTVIAPSGVETKLTLDAAGPGMSRGRWLARSRVTTWRRSSRM